mgnify:CR=1 FL=1
MQQQCLSAKQALQEMEKALTEAVHPWLTDFLIINLNCTHACTRSLTQQQCLSAKQALQKMEKALTEADLAICKVRLCVISWYLCHVLLCAL